MRKADIIIGGLLPALTAGQFVVGEPEFCRPNCEAILEQPHVPHHPYDPPPMVNAWQLVASGQVGDVPFVPGSDDSTAILFHHWEAQRREHWQIAARMQRPMSAAVLWFASTQAAKP